jgi:hypothetical protein
VSFGATERRGQRELELRAEVFRHAPGVARARVLELDRRARLGRALRVVLPLLAGALLSLPIPAWHLVGVPGFAIAALVFGVRRWRQPRVVEQVEGGCPACGEKVRWAVPDSARFPDTYPCPRCREFVKLSEVVRAAADTGAPSPDVADRANDPG